MRKKVYINHTILVYTDYNFKHNIAQTNAEIETIMLSACHESDSAVLLHYSYSAVKNKNFHS
jgi:hypothetical protein